MFENQGYTPKDLVFGDDGRSRLITGISKMASAVKSTLGPGGNTVLIESPNYTHGITVTKDGVTVAKAIDLFDPVENLAVKMMKEAADKTAADAGDGTTTSIILTEALVVKGTEMLSYSSVNRTEVLRCMRYLAEQVVMRLSEASTEVTDDMIHNVASISVNNDAELGKVISDVYMSVGRNGIVMVEKSQTPDTHVDVTFGMRFARGYSSNMFVNDHSNDECVLEDVYVLVSDIEITSVLQIEDVLKDTISTGKKLLIIAPCSQNVINTIAANVMKGNIKACIVQPPSFGYKQNELMSDIALSLGAVYFSEKTGDDLSLIRPIDLGLAKKVTVGRELTTIIRENDISQEANERVDQLYQAHSIAKKKHEKDFIMERIAMLSGGVGIIYAGGKTDLEQKELYDRIDDAICAVRSALADGILPGGGVALDRIDMYSIIGSDFSNEMGVAATIVGYAIGVPIRQILENAGMSYGEVYCVDEPCEDYERFGYNVKTGEYGDMIEMGVIDPTKVTKTALMNAISVAITILSTNAIVTMGRSFEISNIQK